MCDAITPLCRKFNATFYSTYIEIKNEDVITYPHKLS